MSETKRKLSIKKILIRDALLILLILSMFTYVKCRRRDAFTDKGAYKTISLEGKWYKVDVDTITVVTVTKKGTYKEEDVSGKKIKEGTYEIGNHVLRMDNKIYSMNYVDEEKLFQDAIEGDPSLYEFRKYFYIKEKDRKIYYFDNDMEAADQVEDNCSTNEYYEKSGMFDENGFAIDGNGVLLAYNGNAKEITLPPEVEEIAENAMSADYGRAVGTQKITIPATVKKIDTGAFSFSTVHTVVLEQGIEEIGKWAFGDSSIKEIYFPDSIANIQEGILDTEEGLNGMKIYYKSGSQVERYFQQYPPEGEYELIRQ